MYFGCHLSSSGGYLAMGRQALALGADTFQFFTRNPRGGAVKAADPEDMQALRELLHENRFGPLIAHAPYTVNPCSAKPEVRDFAARAMQEDLERLALLPEAYYNFHPGSHTGQGTETGVSQIAELLKRLVSDSSGTVILLETMAGKGSEVGGRFEELASVMDKAGGSERIGVCLDTCHVSDAGYPLAEQTDAVLDEFDRVVGLQHLKALHVNDSKNPCGSHKDRHELIGCGCLGENFFRELVRSERLKGLPAVLETPNTLPGYAEEIARLRAYTH